MAVIAPYVDPSGKRRARIRGLQSIAAGMGQIGQVLLERRLRQEQAAENKRKAGIEERQVANQEKRTKLEERQVANQEKRTKLMEDPTNAESGAAAASAAQSYLSTSAAYEQIMKKPLTAEESKDLRTILSDPKTMQQNLAHWWDFMLPPDKKSELAAIQVGNKFLEEFFSEEPGAKIKREALGQEIKSYMDRQAQQPGKQDFSHTLALIVSDLAEPDVYKRPSRFRGYGAVFSDLPPWAAQAATTQYIDWLLKNTFNDYKLSDKEKQSVADVIEKKNWWTKGIEAVGGFFGGGAPAESTRMPMGGINTTKTPPDSNIPDSDF